MSTYLIEIAFGPVQGFINAARRSRDLWAGSWLLSGLARAAGQSLLDNKATLIYPIASRVRREDKEENSNLSNVLLARVEAASMQDAADIASAAQQAARELLRHHARKAHADWTDAGVKLRDELWERQVEDAVESYAAWSEMGADGYRPAYERLKTSFAARKNTRNFAPMFAPGKEHLGLGVPKSSLDGLRESVLPKDRKTFPARFGLSQGEQLDAMGCIKRVVGRQERFTALPRIAADGWLKELPEQALKGLCDAYEPLVALDLATRSNGNAGVYQTFPYDAGLLFPERFEKALAEADQQLDARGALDRLGKVLRPLWTEHGRPCPYAALIVADGDRMGRFIDRACSAEAHGRVSAALADFADRVPAIAQRHRGHCLFNGGEDLTVLFPLSGVMEGARELAREFNDAIKAVLRELLGEQPDPADRPTLRVGAAICHVLEPLGVIRGYGDAAEKFAKGEGGRDGQGNALGLCLHERGGHEIRLRVSFDDEAAFQAFDDWVAAYDEGSMPGGLAYRIRDAYLRSTEAGLGAQVTAAEVRRAVMHANRRGGEQSMAAAMQKTLCDRARKGGAEVARLADELILARWLSARTAGALTQRSL